MRQVACFVFSAPIKSKDTLLFCPEEELGIPTVVVMSGYPISLHCCSSQFSVLSQISEIKKSWSSQTCYVHRGIYRNSDIVTSFHILCFQYELMVVLTVALSENTAASRIVCQEVAAEM